MKNDLICNKVKPFNYGVIKPNNFMDNKLFCELIDTNCVGNFQYSSPEFLYRDLKEIQTIKRVHIEKIVDIISTKLFEELNVATIVDSTQFGKYFVVLRQGEKVVYKSKDFTTHLEALVDAFVSSKKL